MERQLRQKIGILQVENDQLSNQLRQTRQELSKVEAILTQKLEIANIQLTESL